MNLSFSQDDLAVLLFLRRNPHSTVNFVQLGIANNATHNTNCDARKIENTIVSLEKRGQLLFVGGGSSKRYQLKPATIKALTIEPAVVLSASQLGAVRSRLQSRQAWNAARLDEQDKIHYIAIDRLCEQTKTSFPVCRAALMQLEAEGVVLKVDPPAIVVDRQSSTISSSLNAKHSSTSQTIRLSGTTGDGETLSPSKKQARDPVDKPRILFSPWEAWARKTSWILVNLPYAAPEVCDTSIPHDYLSHEARAIIQYCKQYSLHKHVYLADRYETLGHGATVTFNDSERKLVLCALMEAVERYTARENDHGVGILNAEIAQLHQVVASAEEKEDQRVNNDDIDDHNNDDDNDQDNNHTALMILRAVDVIRQSQLEDVSLALLLQNVPNRVLYTDDIWEQALSVLQD